MKDYQVTIKVKNNYLLQAMKDCGIKTAAELSRLSGVSQITIGRYLNLKATLFRPSDGKYREPILLLAKTLDKNPYDLFPE